MHLPWLSTSVVATAFYIVNSDHLGGCNPRNPPLDPPLHINKLYSLLSLPIVNAFECGPSPSLLAAEIEMLMTVN